MNYKLVLIVLVFCSSILRAQEDYQKWLEQENKKYNNYLSEEDNKFKDFLDKEWKQAGLDKGKTLFEKPKPSKPPVFKADNKPEEKAPIKPEIKIPEKTPIETPIDEKTPEPEVKTPDASAINKIYLDYYGSRLDFDYESSINAKLENPIDNKSIANFFEQLCKSNYKPAAERAKSIKASMKLNDWGLAQVYYNLGIKYFGKNEEANLFTWFMMIKSGYKCRVAYTKQGKVYFLADSKYNLLGLPFFNSEKDGRKFYVLSFDKNIMPPDLVYIYREDPAEAVEELDLTFKTTPNFEQKPGDRTIIFNYKGKSYTYKAKYNKEAVSYYEYYPQIDFRFYPLTYLTPESENSILLELKKSVAGMNTAESLNFLLHFCQDATGYKTDDEQFGREKPLFPEESLYYNYSDCEDRSILFSYLVRKLLNLDVVLLDYPDHIAAAVAIENIPGDNLTWKNKNYLICDPTYLRADIGMCMPQYKKVKPEIIKLF